MVYRDASFFHSLGLPQMAFLSSSPSATALAMSTIKQIVIDIKCYLGFIASAGLSMAGIDHNSIRPH